MSVVLLVTFHSHDSESESRGSKQSKLDKVRKAQSLPRKLPGQDPIALALMHHGNGERRQRSQFSDPYSPASPDDSSSSTTSDSSPVEGSHRFPPSSEGVLHGQQVTSVMVENGHYSPYKYSREPESQTSSSSALVPSRTSNQEGLSQDHEDMHDSLLDLADELGGSAESDEEESPPVKQRTTSTHSQPGKGSVEGMTSVFLSMYSKLDPSFSTHTHTHAHECARMHAHTHARDRKSVV